MGGITGHIVHQGKRLSGTPWWLTREAFESAPSAGEFIARASRAVPALFVQSRAISPTSSSAMTKVCSVEIAEPLVCDCSSSALAHGSALLEL